MRRVFLSHSSADKPFVRKLASDLDQCGIDVWFDEWELGVGDSLHERIAAGMDKSSWLAVVLSINSTRSNWVKKELNAALATELERKKVFVLPILLNECKIPVFLKDKLYADFRSDYSHGFFALMQVIDPKRFPADGREPSMARILGWERPDGSYVYGKHPESF